MPTAEELLAGLADHPPVAPRSPGDVVRRARRRRTRRRVLEGLIILVVAAVAAGTLATLPDEQAQKVQTGPVTSTPVGPCAGFNQRCFRGEPAQGGTVVLGVDSSFGYRFDNLDPAAGTLRGQTLATVALALYDPLVSYDDDGEYTPRLATRWEHSSDLKTWTLTLRTGVVFHDGVRFDASAVVKHFQRLTDPATNCSCVFEVAEIASVEALDSTHIRFGLNQPNGFFLSALAGPLGYVGSPEAPASSGGYGRQPVGTGPFMLGPVDAGPDAGSLVLEKNPRYWRTDEQGRHLPYLDRITVRTIPNTSSGRLALEAGDADIVQTIDPSTILEAEGSDRWSVQKATGTSARALVFNTSRPPFDDVRVRRVLAYGLDRDELSRAWTGGLSPSAEGLFRPGGPGYADDVRWPSYDPAKARRLVEEIERDGEPLQITIIGVPTDDARSAFANVRAQAAKIGVDVKARWLDGGGPFVNALFSGVGDFSAAFFFTEISDAVTQLEGLRAPNRVTNVEVAKYGNKAFDQALTDFRTTSDPDYRGSLHVVQEQLAKDVPILPLILDVAATVYDRTISGLSVPLPSDLGAIDPATLYRRR